MHPIEEKKMRTLNLQHPTSNLEPKEPPFSTSTFDVGRSMFDVRSNSPRRAYTLIEVMVVAVVVLLMIGMALPVFRAITGNRSEAGAANQISATLSLARADAIGLQKTIGIAFIFNTSTQLEDMAEVEFPDCPGWSPTVAYPQGSYVYYAPIVGPGGSPYWYCSTPQQAAGPGGLFPGNPTWTRVGGPPLEIRADTAVIPMPVGIGVQTVCNCGVNNGARTSDGYLNFGVILFDGQGRITCQNYAVSSYSKLANASSLGNDFPLIAAQIKYPYVGGNFGVPSQFGLVIFQREAFNSQKSSIPDPFYTTAVANQQNIYQSSGTPTPQAEELWLDQNATPLVINRYTGTLIRGE